MYNNYNFILPPTLYCSMSIYKLMLILSGDKFSDGIGK